MSNEWPGQKIENPAEEQFNAMYEKAKGVLMTAIIEKIKSGSPEDAKGAMEDFLVFDRVATIVSSGDNKQPDDLNVYQEQINEIAKKYGLEKDILSVDKYRELAKQIK